MKILFVYPEIRTDIPDFSGYYAEGPAVLSAVARAAGHETELLHITRPVSEGSFAAELARREYDVLGFTSLSPVFSHVKRLAPVAREVADSSLRPQPSWPIPGCTPSRPSRTAAC